MKRHGSIGFFEVRSLESCKLSRTAVFWGGGILAGTELWAPEPWGMAATPDGGYVVVGMTQKLGLPVPGWVLKVDSFGCLVPGCHLMDAAIPTQKPITRLSVYPNPATDLLNCYVRGPAGLEGHDLRICNANGQTMTTQTGIQFNTTLIFTVVNWPPGNYFIQCLKDGAVMFTEKFIKI